MQIIHVIKHYLAYFTDINGVPVSHLAGMVVDVLGILPRLGQSSVVPYVALVRKNVGDEPHFPVVVCVLLYGI